MDNFIITQKSEVSVMVYPRPYVKKFYLNSITLTHLILGAWL
jgi:hypothetical protein